MYNGLSEEAYLDIARSRGLSVEEGRERFIRPRNYVALDNSEVVIGVEYPDDATVSLVLTPSTNEEYAHTDADTVYLNIQVIVTVYSFTYGQTTVGATDNPYSFISLNYKIANIYDALEEPGTVVSLWTYLFNYTSGDTQAIRLAIWDDDGSGLPNNLVVLSDEVVINTPISDGWFEFPVSSRPYLEPGVYHLGYHAGGPNDTIVKYTYENKPGQRFYKYDPYSDGTDATFGTPDNPLGDNLWMVMYAEMERIADVLVGVETATVYLDLQASTIEVAEFADDATVYVDLQASGTDIKEVQDSATVYIDVRVVTELLFGIQDTGDTTFLIAENYKAVYRITVTEPITVTKFTAHLSGNDTPGENPNVRAVMYSSSAGEPDALVAASVGLFIDASVPFGWYDFALTTPVFISAGDYWIGFHVGDDSGVANVVFSGHANGFVFRFNPDTFSDGPSNPFGVTEDTDIIGYSLYITGLPIIDTAQFVETATVYLDLQTSGTEIAQDVETAEVYLDIQTSATETAQYVESALVPLVLSVSSADIGQRVDSGTVGLLLTPTSTETAQFVDSTTVLVDIDASSIDTAQFVEANTVLVDLQTSATEVHEIPDAAEVYLDLQTSATEVAVFVDSVEVYLDLQASGTDVYTPLTGTDYPDSATVYLDLDTSAVELHEIPDSASIYLDLSITSTDLLAAIDAVEVYLDLQSSGVEEQSATGFDAATVPFVITPSTVEVFAGVDQATVYLDLLTTTTELAQFVDSNSVPIVLSVTSTDIAEFVDAASTYLDLTVDSTEVFTRTGADADTAYVDLQVTSAELFAAVDQATVPFDLDVLSDETRIQIDAATTYLDLQPASSEVFSPGGIHTVDANTVYLLVTVITPVEVLVGQDATTVLFRLLASGTEVAQYVDAPIVYLDLQPGVIFIQVDYLLKIVGSTKRWMVQTVEQRWTVGVYTGRWRVIAKASRWVVMETRRALWK